MKMASFFSFLLTTLFVSHVSFVVAKSSSSSLSDSGSSRGTVGTAHENAPRFASLSAVQKKLGHKLYTSLKKKTWVPDLHTMRQDSSASPSPAPPIYGFTFDPCFFHADCVDDRLCIRGDFTAACSGAANCICVGEATQLCKDCEECQSYPNESCVKEPEDPSTEGLCASTYTVYEGILVEIGCDTYPDITPIPPDADTNPPSTNGSDTYGQASPSPPNGTPIPSVSTPLKPTPSTTPSPSPPPPNASNNFNDGDVDPNDVCFDARAMHHMSMSQLVFPTHRLAAVLCDTYGSCATPTHMVLHQQVPMTMLTYCRLISGGCSKRVMHVNSPRYSKALRVKSLTPNLYYTALAARYGTAFEERALRIVIHAGF